MKKTFLVTGDARVALSIEVEAESAEEAMALVEGMSWGELSIHPTCELDTSHSGLVLDIDFAEEA